MDRIAVAQFLLEFKKLVKERRLYVEGRDKNIVTLGELGITNDQQRQELLELSVEDYVSGPESDRDRPGEYLYKFKRRINDQEIYIKIKITVDGKYAKCISFHT